VVVDDSGKIVTSLQTDTGFDPMTAAKDLIHGVAYDCIMATGYGRNLFEISFDTLTVTEIKAHAIGARAFFPNVPGSNGFCGSASECNVCYEIIHEFSGSGMTEMSSKDFPEPLPGSFFNL